MERINGNQPDAEYGTTIRIYNSKSQAWDIFYGCEGEVTRLEARKDGEKVVLTEISSEKMKWVFSETTRFKRHFYYPLNACGIGGVVGEEPINVILIRR
ncbi:hypothetical protein MJ257_07140 [Paenibacillus timonensis]|uniref:Uncharacterized protein n=1 Tax=Paenibacillus timonensis TaxID=225915 RepID=A0ABW3S9L7_9BACL|nr:hypothetical protein [Paenibacillus timonensis]MCH1639873.1 hypothetical protein [Paenibacillus timonensis]